MSVSNPTSTSSLIFPEPSRNLPSTLRSLRRSTLCISNRLGSIKDDALFVRRVADVYDLPLVANERCGSWYIPPRKKTGSAYFKSTDGHAGQWSFSLRRLNLQILSLIGENGGCIVVDSTRRGKSMPDALSKTVPIWATVINRVLFPEKEYSHRFQHPQELLGLSEISQIEDRLDGFVAGFLSLKPDVENLRKTLGKPIEIAWIVRDNFPMPVSEYRESHHLLLLCSASRQVKGAEMSEGGYVQGAGDDSEGWSLGLSPEVFWEHEELLSRTPEDDLPTTIEQLLHNDSTSTQLAATQIPPTETLWFCGDGNAGDKGFDFVIYCSPSTEPKDPKKNELYLDCPAGKLGSRDLRRRLGDVKAFADRLMRSTPIPNLLITCSTGKDLSVGVALMILCRYYDQTGRFSAEQSTATITKQLIRERLSWIVTCNPAANPSRATLQSVNAFLMERP